jgi:hypothetical protein
LILNAAARLIALALGVGACMVASPPLAAQTLTLAEAQALKPAELGKTLLGMLGKDVREAQVSSTSALLPPVGGPARIQSIWLAWAPISAGFPGLCQAKTVYISFGTSTDDGGMPSDFSTGTAYRIVGLTQPLPDMWNDKYRRSLAEKCRQAGPVLQTPGSLGFFRGQVEGRNFRAGDASFVARSLDIARQYSGAIGCVPDPSVPKDTLCADPRRSLFELSLDDMSGADVQQCADQPATLCATLYFVQRGFPASEGSHMIWVSLATDATKADPPPSRIRIRSVKLDGQNIVY